MSLQGVCTKWLVGKGFGFIKPAAEGEQEVLALADRLVGGSRLQEGAAVTFDYDDSEPKTKRQREAKAQGKRIAATVSGPGVIAATQGASMGTVTEWHPGLGYGFILGTDGSRNYVHGSAFNGARLQIGKTVMYDVEDVNHKSGRKVAINVAGSAVTARGGTRGIVKSWMHHKGYGFAQDINGVEVFVHATEVGSGWLMVGRELWYDIREVDEDKEAGADDSATKKLQACNVSGEAIRDASHPPDLSKGFGKGAKGAAVKGGKGAVKGGKAVKGAKGGKGAKAGGATVQPGVEKRMDTDGKYYTKDDFVKEYGGLAEWGQREETRPSPKNGNYYTKEMFKSYFGGLTEWDAAAPAASNAYQPYGRGGRGGRGGGK